MATVKTALKNHFEQRYRVSLNAYRYFYDDVHEYGCAESADHVFYFIPGLNGVAGQVRFTLPAFHSVFGNRFYIRGLYMPEFSASCPIWEKYTEANLKKRRAIIQDDLEGLVARHGRVYILASSTGFYEFAAAFGSFPPVLRAALTLIWAAAAPDSFEPTCWESVFFPLNGIERNGRRWTALPNHNAFGMLNTEARATFRWRAPDGIQTLYKGNLESRFQALGVSWAYFSIDHTNWLMQQCAERIAAPLDIKAYILAGTRDGYWQGKSQEEMARLIGRYLSRPQFLWKKASHLWITTPENISELLQLATRTTSPASPASVA